MEPEAIVTEPESLPQDKAHLMEKIRLAWAALEQTIRLLSEAELTTPGLNDGWSVKDHLAHLSAWEQRLLAAIQERPAHEGLQIDEAMYLSGDTDSINALIFARNVDRSLLEVMDEFRRSQRELWHALERLSDADLRRPYIPDDPSDSRWLIHGIIGNTYEHYQEHEEWIGALIVGIRQSDTI